MRSIALKVNCKMMMRVVNVIVSCKMLILKQLQLYFHGEQSHVGTEWFY